MDNFLKLMYGKCYLCEKPGNVICVRCFNKLSGSDEVCFVCKNPSKRGKTHPFCFSESVPDFFQSLYFYNEVSSKILIKSKYEPYEFYLLKYLIRNTDFELHFLKDSFLVPTPISSLKMFERRFNQAELISNELAKKFNLDTVNLIKRKRDSRSLYDLDFKGRKSEITGVFDTKIFAKLYQKHPILLIDDLKTTGQTIMEATKVLRKAGFKNIHAFSLFLA